jgi:group I intron endonuclease
MLKLAISNIVYFYTLTDPITSEVRYVGCTGDLVERFYNHLYFARKNSYPNNHKDNWIRILFGKGLIPILTEIDKIINDGQNYKEREIFLIKKYRDLGCDLTNMDDGGTGWGFGNQIWKGRKHSEEYKKNMSEFLKNHDVSIETRILMSKVKNKKAGDFNYKTKFHKRSRPINVYDATTNKLLYEFASILECSNRLNLNRTFIKRRIQENKPYINYKFKIKQKKNGNSKKIIDKTL